MLELATISAICPALPATGTRSVEDQLRDTDRLLLARSHVASASCDHIFTNALQLLSSEVRNWTPRSLALRT